MGHAAEREKKIINLERLIAREKEREEEKRTSDCRQKGERGRERWAFRSKWVFVQSRDTERGGNKYGGGAKNASSKATAKPLIKPLKGPRPDRRAVSDYLPKRQMNPAIINLVSLLI